MSTPTPSWKSSDPIEQRKIDLESLGRLYSLRTVRTSVYLAIEALEAIAELAFGAEELAKLLSNEISLGYHDIQHFKDLMERSGVKVGVGSKALIAEHLKLEVLAACSQLSIALYFAKTKPKLASYPLQEAMFHLGCTQGLAHLQLNKPTGASAGGVKKASNAAIRRAASRKEIINLFHSEMPEHGWPSINLAIKHIAPKLVGISRAKGLGLKKKTTTIISEILNIIDSDVVLKEAVEKTTFEYRKSNSNPRLSEK